MGSAPASRNTSTVVIVLPRLGAVAPPDAVVGEAAGATVVAVDGGTDHALDLGLHVDVAVGDFDSVTAGGLARVEAAGAEVRRHPAAKDLTDFELGVDVALGLAPRRIVVLGGRGGRLDHALANLLSLGAPSLAGVEVVAHLDGSTVTVVRHRAELEGAPGSLLSLLPVGGPATGVRTEGLRYPLHDEELPVGSARGVSNVLLGHRAAVSVTRGVLLAVQPDPSTPETPDDQ